MGVDNCVSRSMEFTLRPCISPVPSRKIIESLNRADAHPYGLRPFKRANYIKKFLILTNGILDKKESHRFIKDVQNLKKIKAGRLDKLNIIVKRSLIKKNLRKGIF